MFQIHKIHPDTISAKEFNEKYIKTRNPVILSCISSDLKQLEKLSSLDYLVSKQSKVQVESKLNSGFGSGNPRSTIDFGKFISSLQDGNENQYMTTQYDPNGDDFTQYCHSPLHNFIKDIPTRPTLMNNLIPQQINLWIGNATLPTSSGLHHDFADNLYILLEGNKTFQIFPPTDYIHLITGKVLNLYENGLFCYETNLRSDGAYLGHVIQEKINQLIELNDDLSLKEIKTLKMELKELEDLEEDEPDHENSIKDSLAPNFSRISHEMLKNKEYSKECSTTSFTLSKGEMLYLPAGWFHNVESIGSPHIAFNYWFHPPDRNGGYVDEYWENNWKRIAKDDRMKGWVMGTVDEASWSI